MGYRYSVEKNTELLNQRDISFEEVIAAIEAGQILALYPHPNTGRYPNQKIIVVSIKNYAYVVPFVEEENGDFFLKTIFPDRKLTKKYLGENNDR